MTITPDELRNVTFRESLRGYHRADVDEICARAAETIEALEHQLRALRQGLGTASDTGAVRVIQPGERAVNDGEIIQRTLVLAQKAADEAVAEAQQRAHKLTSESEAKANAMVAEAEANARRLGEQERRRVAEEIERLGATRDVLRTDVDALERFTEEFRGRIHNAIIRELDRLEQSSVGEITPPERPQLQTVRRAEPTETESEGTELHDEAHVTARVG